MPQDREDVRSRLRDAAWDLYAERGYDQTTAAEIAARIGVTERTFFRYFTDKREVAFEGEAALRTALMAAIAAAPPSLGSLDALLLAFKSFEAVFDRNRTTHGSRQAIIDATPALYERQLAKTAALTKDVATALRGRGVEAGLATLAAHAGMAALHQATASWREAPGENLGAHLDHAFHNLRSLAAQNDHENL